MTDMIDRPTVDGEIAAVPSPTPGAAANPVGASQTVIGALDSVRAELGGLREQRKAINSRIKRLVGQAALLERMSRLAEDVLALEGESDDTGGDDDDGDDDHEGDGPAE